MAVIYDTEADNAIYILHQCSDFNLHFFMYNYNLFYMSI